jgi:hypothetical protein
MAEGYPLAPHLSTYGRRLGTKIKTIGILVRADRNGVGTTPDFGFTILASEGLSILQA